MAPREAQDVCAALPSLTGGSPYFKWGEGAATNCTGSSLCSYVFLPVGRGPCGIGFCNRNTGYCATKFLGCNVLRPLFCAVRLPSVSRGSMLGKENLTEGPRS
eukprot:1068090-Rhodomonas_salina.3